MENEAQISLSPRAKQTLIAAAVFVLIGGLLSLLGGGGKDEEATPPAEEPALEQAAQDGGGTGTTSSGTTGQKSISPDSLAKQGIGVAEPGSSSFVQDDSQTIPWPPPGAEGVPVPEEETGSSDEVRAEPGAAGWSPFFLKGGFSFFVAFCVGYATRMWLKLSAIFLGTFFLGVFILSYFGALDVDWTTIEGWWNAAVARIEAEAVDFKTFITGSLPQAGAAGMGLIAGFRGRG